MTPPNNKPLKCEAGQDCPIATETHELIIKVEKERIKRKDQEEVADKDRKCYREKIDAIKHLVERVHLAMYGDEDAQLIGFIQKFSEYQKYEIDLKFIKGFRKILFWVAITAIPTLLIGFIVWVLSLYQLTAMMKQHIDADQVKRKVTPSSHIERVCDEKNRFDKITFWNSRRSRFEYNNGT